MIEELKGTDQSEGMRMIEDVDSMIKWNYRVQPKATERPSACIEV